MDSISGTTTITVNHKSTDPLKPEKLEVDYCERKLSHSNPPNQLNEDRNDANSKDHEDINSLHDYNLQTVNSGNSVDDSKISLRLELGSLLVKGNAAKANTKMAEAIKKNLTLAGLISEVELADYLSKYLQHTIAEQYTYWEEPRFQELIENLVKLGINPSNALLKTFVSYTSMKVFIQRGVLDKNIHLYLKAAEAATKVNFKDLLKEHIHLQLCLTLKIDKAFGLIYTEQYLKLLHTVGIELDRQLLASELQPWLADAIYQKDIWPIITVIEMEKKWNFGLQIDSIMVPEVKADWEDHLHAELKTAMKKNDFYQIIELVQLANNLGLNYKNDDLKQPMTNCLFASFDSSCLPRLLEIAETLDLNLNKLIPELKEQYPSFFYSSLQEYLEASCTKETLISWYKKIKSHGIDLHDHREALDSFIFNELFVHILGNLKEHKETTLPSIDDTFNNHLYHHPYDQLKSNADLLEIDFNQPEIKDKIFDLSRQMILKHYDHYDGSSSQFPLVVNVTQH